MKFVWLTALAAGLLVLAAGCIDVEYVGQKFEPLPEYATVRIFKEKADFPADQYKVIGRATFTAPDGYSSVDIWEKIMETAREYGADGVKVVSSQRELTNSVYRQPEDGRRVSSARTGTTGVGPDGAQIYIDSFGEQVQGNYSRVDSYELVIKVLMLLDKKSFDSAMTERERRFDEVLENHAKPKVSPVSAAQPQVPSATPASAVPDAKDAASAPAAPDAKAAAPAPAVPDAKDAVSADAAIDADEGKETAIDAAEVKSAAPASGEASAK